MITIHAKDQYKNRILPATGKQISTQRLEALGKLWPRGKHYVRVANLPKVITAKDGSTGNCITAIVNNGDIITLMLSLDTQRWADGTFRVRLIA